MKNYYYYLAITGLLIVIIIFFNRCNTPDVMSQAPGHESFAAIVQA